MLWFSSNSNYHSECKSQRVATSPCTTVLTWLRRSRENSMFSSRSFTSSPPTAAEMMGVATESFAEAPTGSGKKLPFLCRENHTPISEAFLFILPKREDGRCIVPSTSESSSFRLLAILRGPICANGGRMKSIFYTNMTKISIISISHINVLGLVC